MPRRLQPRVGHVMTITGWFRRQSSSFNRLIEKRSHGDDGKLCWSLSLDTGFALGDAVVSNTRNFDGASSLPWPSDQKSAIKSDTWTFFAFAIATRKVDAKKIKSAVDDNLSTAGTYRFAIGASVHSGTFAAWSSPEMDCASGYVALGDTVEGQMVNLHVLDHLLDERDLLQQNDWGMPIEEVLAPSGIAFGIETSISSGGQKTPDESMDRTDVDPSDPENIEHLATEPAKWHPNSFQIPSTEYFLVSPPLVSQTRSSLVPCSQFFPALKNQFVDLQMELSAGKCGVLDNGFPNIPCRVDVAGEYADPNKKPVSELTASLLESQDGWRLCVDKSRYATGKYWQNSVIEWVNSEASAYVEYLEALQQETLVRGGNVYYTDHWLDSQTQSVELVMLLLKPDDRIFTLLKCEWIADGQKATRGIYDHCTQYTHRQMTSHEQQWLIFFTAVPLLLLCFDLNMLRKKYRKMKRNRQFWQQSYEGMLDHGDDAEKARQGQQMKEQLRLTYPVMEKMDYFDIIYCLWTFFFLALNLLFFYSSSLEDTNVGGNWEKALRPILSVQWWDTRSSIEQFTEYVGSMRDLLALLETGKQLSLLGSGLVLLSAGRIIIFMRSHPRIALLYETLYLASDDVWHFMLGFVFLYLILGFIAYLEFGLGQTNAFGSFFSALYTQLQMIIGEYPFEDYTLTRAPYIFYVFFFILFVVYILLNLFFAIIIESFAQVKNSVSTCVVEKTLLADGLLAFVIHPIVYRAADFHHRTDLILRLLFWDNDVDPEGKYWAPTALISREALQQQGITRNEVEGEFLLYYYSYCIPALSEDTSPEEEDAVALSHKRVMINLLKLTDAFVASVPSEGTEVKMRRDNDAGDAKISEEKDIANDAVDGRAILDIVNQVQAEQLMLEERVGVMIKDSEERILNALEKLQDGLKASSPMSESAVWPSPFNLKLKTLAQKRCRKEKRTQKKQEERTFISIPGTKSEGLLERKTLDNNEIHSARPERSVKYRSTWLKDRAEAMEEEFTLGEGDKVENTAVKAPRSPRNENVIPSRPIPTEIFSPSVVKIDTANAFVAPDGHEYDFDALQLKDERLRYDHDSTDERMDMVTSSSDQN